VAIGATLRDALRVYRLLWARSVLVAAIVYALIALVQLVEHAAGSTGAALLGLLAAAASLAGPALVQGSLIGIVRNVHEGRAPESIQQLLGDARARLWRLIGAAFVYAFGIIGGLLLLIVPGLIVVARWSLMPAVVMLEGKSVGDARRRSRELVNGHSFAVFMCLLLSGLVVAAPAVAVLSAHRGFGTSTFVNFVWSALTAPFIAHLLTVIYYRRSEPARPVIDPAVLEWKNVWAGR
jgi:hypothetical protein